jgi:PAS domain S-box-containing protein
MTSHVGEHSSPGIVQESLARLASLLETLFETAPDAVFLMDGLRFLDCNPATLRMFGCTKKADIVGRTPVEFSPPKQPDGTASSEAAGRLALGAIEGEPQLFEWRHARLDRSEFDVEVRLNRFVVSGSVFLIAVVRDITRRKEVEARVRRRLEAEDLISDVLARLATCRPSEFDVEMERALAELSRFLGADHTYFFLKASERDTYDCTHEACGPGVRPLREQFRDVPVGTHPWIERALVKGEDVHTEQPTVLLVPTRGTLMQLAGTLGVESKTRREPWSESDIVLCRIVASALTGTHERMNATAKLVAEKEFSDRLIDCLPGVLYVYDSALHLRRWNKNFEERTGRKADELRDQDAGSLLGDDRTRVIESAREILARGGATTFMETELTLKNGRAVPYLISGAHVDSPEGPMLVGVGIDIAARRAAEEALAASERNYRELFDATSDALFVHDETGRVLDVNLPARAMFGIGGEDDVRVLSIDDLSLGESPYSQREATERLRQAIAHGAQVFDWQSRRQDGSLFWSEVALRAARIGGEARVIASVRDITERKLAALERERLMAELRTAISAKDQFLAVLSHELRNPLAAIQAGVGLLRHTCAGDARGIRALDVIDRNVRLQARLVNDLLDMSRLARGKLAIHRAPVRLDEIVLAAARSCESDASRAGVSLEIRVDARQALWVEADAERIQQVVINLVDNGIKFTPKGGRVTVSVREEDGRALIVVEDTGLGIEAERLPELFQMFRQGEIGAQRARGLGIGLAVVKSITDLHGGRVQAESPGTHRGSRFTVELDRCAAPELAGEPEPSPPTAARMRMLLLEDNADTRSVLAETFAVLAYEVIAVESGEAALQALAGPDAKSVDVILADIGLPGMNGYEFLQRARHLPAAAGARAFALTGYGQESDVQRAREVGYVDHFVKPVDVKVIDERIREGIQGGIDYSGAPLR